jgi:Zn-dependent M28 family amino/carboxypeptidase
MTRALRSFIPVLATLLVAVSGCNPAPRPVETDAVVTPVTAPTTAPAAPPAAVAPVSVDAVPPFVDPRRTVPFLASDALAGRMPCTPGLARAGDALAEDFQRLGLRPLPGQADDFQPFTMRLSTTLDPITGLLVDGCPLTVGLDFDPMSVSREGRFEGQVVFAGYGITHVANGRTDYDDYAGLDVSGKVVLAMMKEPTDGHGASRFAAAGQAWSDEAHFNRKAATAAAHGATALLLVSPPSSGGPDEVRPFFADSDPTSTAALPVVQVSRRVADLLLTTANQPDLKALQDTINDAFAPRSVALSDVSASGEVVVKRSVANVRNVMACLPGTGPHADEWVVVGAHYDHLGTGQLGHMFGPVGSIYHGADDNASGTAAVLELAAKLKGAPPLPRSVLFVLFTGEEEGLIGSDHFVKHPPVPLDHVVAMLNMDMVGRLKNDDLLIGGAGTAKAFDGIVADAIAGTGLHTTTFERGGLGPSDHMSFALQRIPVLFLFTGLHADYHRPTDTADKVNYAGIDRIVTVAQRVVTALAGLPRQPYDGSADSQSTMATVSGHGTGGGRASLGVVPDYSAADSPAPGVPISGVGPATPAAVAGLRGGDRLVGFNAKRLDNLQDLADALAEASPGDKVDVRVVRDGQPLVLHAVLGERKQPR